MWWRYYFFQEFSYLLIIVRMKRYEVDAAYIVTGVWCYIGSLRIHKTHYINTITSLLNDDISTNSTLWEQKCVFLLVMLPLYLTVMLFNNINHISLYFSLIVVFEIKFSSYQILNTKLFLCKFFLHLLRSSDQF